MATAIMLCGGMAGTALAAGASAPGADESVVNEEAYNAFVESLSTRFGTMPTAVSPASSAYPTNEYGFPEPPAYKEWEDNYVPYTMPDVVGMTEEEAYAAIAEANPNEERPELSDEERTEYEAAVAAYHDVHGAVPLSRTMVIYKRAALLWRQSPRRALR
jgi:hypothetical protein